MNYCTTTEDPAQIESGMFLIVKVLCGPNFSDLTNLARAMLWTIVYLSRLFKKCKVFADDVSINVIRSSLTKPGNTLNSGLNEINSFSDKLLNCYFTVDIPYWKSQ